MVIIAEADQRQPMVELTAICRILVCMAEVGDHDVDIHFLVRNVVRDRDLARSGINIFELEVDPNLGMVEPDPPGALVRGRVGLASPSARGADVEDELGELPDVLLELADEL